MFLQLVLSSNIFGQELPKPNHKKNYSPQLKESTYRKVDLLNYRSSINKAEIKSKNRYPHFRISKSAETNSEVFSGFPGGGTDGGTVFAIAVSGNDIYVGGCFTTIGGDTVNHIAKWNTISQTWSPLGTGMDDAVYAIAVDGSNIYAGGYFSEAGGVISYSIAKWDGSNWSRLADSLTFGMNGPVYTLAINNGYLYAGGNFSYADTVHAENIARWNGTKWDSLGTPSSNGVNSDVYTIDFDQNGNLYAGGTFELIGTDTVNYIAKWNGTNWTKLGSLNYGVGGLPGDVESINFLKIAGDDIYVGGMFSTAGNDSALNIAKWNISTQTWAPMGSGLPISPAAISIINSNKIYVGADALGSSNSPLFKWDGSNWIEITGVFNTDDFVGALALLGSTMYIGGYFFSYGNIAYFIDDTTPLPIELSKFTASKIGNSVILNWRTETELNNYGFQVEREKENNIWEAIGFIKGNGNSNSPKEYSFTDNPSITENHNLIKYRLKQIDFDGSYLFSNPIEIIFEIPVQFSLQQNFPNPFNPSTVINYNIPVAGNVNLKIYDVLGNEVAILVNEFKQPGSYAAPFSKNDFQLSSGIYFYRINVSNPQLSSGKVFTQTKKMILMK